MENTETIYKVGDRVWCPSYGWGEVIDIDDDSFWPIMVQFYNATDDFTPDGRIYAGAPVCLFFTEQQYSVERPKWQPKKGEWCWFWNDGEPAYTLSQFQQIWDGMYIDINDGAWTNCVIHIGELPNFLEKKSCG